jgi:hypothetical protein
MFMEKKMSFVDFEPERQRSLSDRLQASWDHPHPYGLIAMLKAALNSIPDAVNGSIAATGPYPSTEEEAFRYNEARDRGVAGVVDAASHFGPLAPEFAAGALGRGFLNGSPRAAIESRVPNADARALPNPASRYGSEPHLGQPSVPTVSAPSISPPGAVTRSGGLLGRLRDLDELERQVPSKAAPPVLPESKNPNFRQLKRVIITKGSDVVGGGSGPNSSPRTNAEIAVSPRAPSWLPPGSELASERRADGSRFPGYGGGGNGGDGGSGKRENDDDDGDPCTKHWTKERDEWCPQFGTISYRNQEACEHRANERQSLCKRNGHWPGLGELKRYDWNDIVGNGN